MRPLFHIALADDWAAARAAGVYQVSTIGATLDEVGFIHLSFAEQVAGVADAAYRGREDLVLLELDPERLGAPVRVESGSGRADGERFPHLYGALDPAAVVAVHPLAPRADGTFEPIA